MTVQHGAQHRNKQKRRGKYRNVDSICQPLLIARQKAAARGDGLAALGLQTFGRFQKRKQQLLFNIVLRDGTFCNIPDRAVTDMGEMYSRFRYPR